MTPLPLMAMAFQPDACKVPQKQRGLLGIVRQGSAAQLGNKKRRLLRMPTIVEEDPEEDFVLALPARSTAEAGHQPRPQLQLPPNVLPEFAPGLLRLTTHASYADEVLAQLKCAGESDRRVLLAWLSVGLPSLAFSETGSHVVELACKVAKGAERYALIFKLQGFVAHLCVSAHGHQVLTTIVETMPVSTIGFVATELLGQAGDVARNKFGYRVLEAMIMHCSESQMADLARELVSEAVALAKHPYGNFVIQHLLEYGTEASRSAIIEQLLCEMPLLAMDRAASNVVAKALEASDAQTQTSIAMTLLHTAKPISIVDVACSRCGSSILVELANANTCAAELRLRLGEAAPRLTRSKFGRRVVDQFGLMA